jgi:hypothetical protein
MSDNVIQLRDFKTAEELRIQAGRYDDRMGLNVAEEADTAPSEYVAPTDDCA